MAKLNRERALLERRHRKQARKEARKLAAANGEDAAAPASAHADGDAAHVAEPA